MVHIVITMLAVSSDAVKIRIIIQICPDFIESGIGIEICGIGFFHHLFVEIQNLRRIIDDTHLDEFRYGKGLPLDIALIPVIIPFIAEVFKSDPRCFVRIAYHIRRPVVINLNPAKFHRGILNINPAFRNKIIQRFDFGRILDFKRRNQNSQNNQVAVRQSFCGIFHIKRHMLHTCN